MSKNKNLKQKIRGSVSIEAALVFPLFILIVIVIAIVCRISVATSNLKHIALLNADSFATSTESVADFVLVRLNAKKQWIAGEDGLKLVGPTRASGEVSVKAKATVKCYVPFFNISPIRISQTGVSLEWIDNGSGNDEQNQENVWNLPPMERGNVIQTHFGRNLPEFFPSICIFKNSKAVSIISMDVTLKTYTEPGGIEKEISKAGQNLSDFSGGQNGSVIILDSQVIVKELWIVIPAGQLTAIQENEIANALKVVTSKGVKVKVIEYLKKGEIKK